MTMKKDKLYEAPVTKLLEIRVERNVLLSGNPSACGENADWYEDDLL